MELTEQDQRPGRFRVDLTSSAPFEAVRMLRETVADGSGFVVVTTVDSPAPPTLDAAEYVGFLDESTGVRSFGGGGVVQELGRDDGDGPLLANNPVQSLDAWVTQIVANTGIVKGAVSGGVGTWRPVLETYLVEHRRSILDMVCQHFGVVWRIRDGDTLDVGPRSTLYPAASVVVTDRPGSQQSGTAGTVSTVGAYALSPFIDARSRTSNTTGFGDPLNDISPAAIAIKSAHDADGDRVGIAGTRAAAGRDFHVVDLPDSGISDVQDFVDRDIATRSQPRVGFSVATRPGGRIRQRLPVGSPMFVWFPQVGVEDLVNVIPVNGSHMFPSERVLISAQWSLPTGHGVWLHRPEHAQPWENLTRYVVFGDGSAMLEVSADVDYRFSPGYDRYGKGSILTRLVTARQMYEAAT